MMLRLTLVLALLAILAGCSDAPAEVPKRTVSREKATAERLAATPLPRTYRYDGSELRVLDVPVSSDGKFVDMQRCFVWRDAEFKTSSISCGAGADIGPTEHPDPR